MSSSANLLKLWFWPWEAALAVTRAMETATAAQKVLAVRLPMISAAAMNPVMADHGELALMVSEKVEAFRRSGLSVSRAGDIVQRTASAHMRDLEHMAKGGFYGPWEWVVMAERNLLIAATLVALPLQALAPIHQGATANARRLRRSPART
jgi:hypothetical protein